ncbi:MAG: DegV family protein, partial [bacterium]
YMAKIKLISDSTCDLTKDLILRHDIDIVPLFVSFREESYLDGVNLSVTEMYRKVKDVGYLPKTSAASPGAFLELFQKYAEANIDVLYIGLGSHFSATYQSAVTAKMDLGSDKIHLIDSGNLSSGSGLLVLKAAAYRDAGDSIEMIEAKIQALIPKVRTQFVINTMEYLYRGGRCSGVAALMGTLLKIKPIIKVKDGQMHVGKKPHGRIQVGLDVLIAELMEAKDELDDEFLMITHSLAHDSAEYIREKISNVVPIRHIYETDAGCVISSHCGEGCIGILYIVR